MKWLAHFVTVVLIIAYTTMLQVVIYLVPPTTPDWMSLPIAVVYGIFMIVSMGALFNTFPEPLQKYFRNKTPDNPDGCGI